MKKGFYNVLIALCFNILFAVGIPVQSQAAKVLSSSLKVEGENKVKLSWKKQAVDEYRIYRADSADGNYRLLAKVSGNKKSYTDKTAVANKEYDYLIKGYKKKNGKLTCVYKNNSLYAYTGLAPLWGTYDYCETKTKPTAIPLTVHLEKYNLHPSGVELYRKTGSNKYIKIKTVKPKKNQYTLKYTDRNVKKGKTYYYKLRYYKVIKGRKVYSEYSQPLKLRAVNYIGDYTMKTLTKGDQQVTSLEFSLTSNKGNGTMTIDAEFACDYIYEKKDSDEIKEVELLLKAYSFDNKKWVTDFDEVNLKEGQTIYLRFQKSDYSYYSDLYYEEKTDSDFCFVQESSLRIPVIYSGFHYYCDVDFLTNQVEVQLDSEYYH